MARKAVFRGKVYRPVKFGEGMQPGTVEWELARRQRRKREREEDEVFEARIAAGEEMELKGIWRVFDAIVRFFKRPD